MGRLYDASRRWEGLEGPEGTSGDQKDEIHQLPRAARELRGACIDSDCSSPFPMPPARASQPTAVTLDSLG